MAYLNVDKWIYDNLGASPVLTTGGGVVYHYPNDWSKMPIVVYRTETRTSDIDYQDNTANMIDLDVTIDIYSSNGTDDFTLCNEVADIMAGLLFNLDSSIPVPDPDSRLQHRAMIFNRQGIMPETII